MYLYFVIIKIVAVVVFVTIKTNDFCLFVYVHQTNKKHIDSLNRYYLEAASPLKSITNTAQLAPTQKHQLNSATLLTNGSAKTIEENNGFLWTNSKTSNDTSNRGWMSSNDNNSLFTNHMSSSVTSNGSLNSNTNTNSKSNGTSINGLTLNGNKARDNIKKNGFHLPPPGSNMQNGHKNLFTPDTDFVADFGSANIFDALNNKPSINNTSTNNTNNLLNGNATLHHSNGVELTNGHQNNGNNGNNGSVDENFADFEHNTIYNAAGELVLAFHVNIE